MLYSELMALFKYSKKYSQLLIWLLILILGLIAGLVLIRRSQEIRKQAAVSNICPGAQQCPYANDPTHLWSCTPPDGDGTVQDSICNRAGRTAVCGNITYCCPAPNTSWTRDMTACPPPTAPPTASPQPTNPPVSTDPPLSTAEPTSTPTASPAPVFRIGDINRDGFVDIVDIGILIDNYALLPIVDIRCDLNNDGEVNIVDVGLIIDNYGMII
jgi:hypothetical protein